HDTTLVLANLFFRCDCGHESQSRLHSEKCTIGRTTLVRKGSKPIKRVRHTGGSQQCVRCEVSCIFVEKITSKFSNNQK
ncbi:hypothetical protein PMAYCL1PPCAC_07857, partial [Pristionchus mayeri]